MLSLASLDVRQRRGRRIVDPNRLASNHQGSARYHRSDPTAERQNPLEHPIDEPPRQHLGEFGSAHLVEERRPYREHGHWAIIWPSGRSDNQLTSRVQLRHPRAEWRTVHSPPPSIPHRSPSSSRLPVPGERHWRSAFAPSSRLPACIAGRSATEAWRWHRTV
jgi:hypothetical protein